MGLKSELVWESEKGNRNLIRLKEGGQIATVIISDASEDELRELAKAAVEAADQIRGFRQDAADVRKPK
jgi:hypothetical protein